MNCEKCNKSVDGTYGSGRFCSRICANSRGTRSPETKDKISKALVGNKPWNTGKKLVPRIKRTCPRCGLEFEVKESSIKFYCSGKCNPNVGGYREGSGRSKSGYYKGIYCGSSYELVWVIYRLDHGLSVQRFEGSIVGDGITYFPDFIEDSMIIEIKGYEQANKVKAKTKLAKSKGYDVKILRREDLAQEFKWVEDNYSYNVVWELYDNYSPTYNYVCNHCGLGFNRDKKAKTEIVFCSRKCAGKFRAEEKKNLIHK